MQFIADVILQLVSLLCLLHNLYIAINALRSNLRGESTAAAAVVTAPMIPRPLKRKKPEEDDEDLEEPEPITEDSEQPTLRKKIRKRLRAVGQQLKKRLRDVEMKLMRRQVNRPPPLPELLARYSRLPYRG